MFIFHLFLCDFFIFPAVESCPTLRVRPKSSEATTRCGVVPLAGVTSCSNHSNNTSSSNSNGSSSSNKKREDLTSLGSDDSGGKQLWMTCIRIELQ